MFCHILTCISVLLSDDTSIQVNIYFWCLRFGAPCLSGTQNCFLCFFYFAFSEVQISFAWFIWINLFQIWQKRGTLSAGSWTIQDEIRKVRSKATEDMLRSLPSTRIDLSSFSLEHKNIRSSVVPDDGSDKVHVSKSLPEIEPVDASVDLVVGSSTIQDSKGIIVLCCSDDVFFM